MAAYPFNSPSPRVLAQDPVTPVHSPHHSIHSSTSSRTPLHTLTLHEYRRQQNTPISRVATPPPGKSLRRKAAGAALNGIERSSPTSRPPLSASFQPTRSLHISQSAQQLTSHQTVSTSPSLLNQQAPLNGLRSQSADPTAQLGTRFGNPLSESSDKVRYFKPIKKLPKPPAFASDGYPVPLLASVKPRPPGLSPLQTSSSLLTQISYSSEAQPTPSSFSLSRFPQPPHLIDPSLSPPHDENEPPLLNSVTYLSTAPETPPATPAVIHYRGTSFDLVNPHDSLLLHDIVTPSREIDSSEYLPLRSSSDPLVSPEVMAPRRPLYGDLTSAHAAVTGTPSDIVPPMPATLSPGSSQFTSPFYSPDSNESVSPPSVKKQTNESRFSLKQVKQLTRSLTKKLGKTPEVEQGEELRNLNGSNVSVATTHHEGEYPRPLVETYITTPKASYFPVSALSPITPDPPSKPANTALYDDNLEDHVGSYEHLSSQRYSSAHLTSMIPEEDSVQLGRGREASMSISQDHSLNVPSYYDDTASIYATSSIYTGDGRVVSHMSTASNGRNNKFRLSSIDPESFTYSRDNLYSYGGYYSTFKPLPRDYPHSSQDQGDEKTDTISKFIDHYEQHPAENTSSLESDDSNAGLGLVVSESGAFEEIPLNSGQPTRVMSGLGQLEYDRRRSSHGDEPVPSVQQGPARRPTITHRHKSPPLVPAPLTPSFRHGRSQGYSYPETSEMFSNSSSYGDTRNLLCLTPHKDSDITEYERIPAIPETGPEPSSSYSQAEAKSLVASSSYSRTDEQPGVSPKTPQEALDQAEQIFGSAVAGSVAAGEKQPDDGIPAMWAKRNSVSLIRAKRSAKSQSIDTDRFSRDYGNNRGSKIGSDGGDMLDWETVADNSQGERQSLDSLADYSSSDGDRNSLGLSFEANGTVSQASFRKATQGSSFYSHPSPLRTLRNPFNSSPPELTMRTGVRTDLDITSSSPFESSPAAVIGQGAVEQPAPLTGMYALSDKETQELLASGPNDDILFEDEDQDILRSGGFDRENTFEKFTVLGPRGNLTGTPLGSGMHHVGSSVANTSSPGADLSSSPYHRSRPSKYRGFYSSPAPAMASFTKIRKSSSNTSQEHERSPSNMTLYENPYSLEPVQNSSPLSGSRNARHSPRSSTSHNKRRGSRAAVPGQTKLRQMMLAPDAMTDASSLTSNVTRFPRGRASTVDTTTPLRPSHASISALTAQSFVGHQDRNSPHILVPMRKLNDRDLAEKRKLEWLIFALFCVFPPCLILYRWLGDLVIVSVTAGRFRECSRESKRIALAAGIIFNMLLVAAIITPICVLYSLGKL